MRIFFAGGGQCVEYIARRLIREGNDVVLLEQDEERCQYLNEKLDARVIMGDVSCIADWKKAGLAEADMFMACTHSDEMNVLACMIADDVVPEALKAIRLRTPEYLQWKQTFDRLNLRVDRVVHPESDVVNRILRVIAIPGVADIRNFAGERIKLFSMSLRPNSQLVGTKVGDFDLLVGTGVAIIGVVLRGDEAIIPHQDQVLKTGDHVYIVTSAEHLDVVLEQVGIVKRHQIRQVFIAGGGEVGLELSRALEQRKVPVKLFEKDAKRCEYLSRELEHTVVIHADGTSQEVLRETNVEGIDAFISLTGDEDANLISCLLARRMEVDKVIPLVTSMNYIELAQRLGINTTVNPRIKAADALLEFIRKGGVHSVRTLGENKVEVIELEVAPDSEYIGLSLKDIKLPEDCLIGAVAQSEGTVVIPDTETRVNALDTLIIFSHVDALKELQKKILSANR
jgi:trk system potassium uptake protein